MGLQPASIGLAHIITITGGYMQSKIRGIGFFVLITTVLLGMTYAGLQAQQQPDVHWTYEGEEGPAHWGNLRDGFKLCSTGTTQSPIDIESTVSANISDIQFNYSDSAVNILNNGHTVQVNYDPGSSIMYDGVQYDLAQFHFHHPSEHTVNGEAAPMEAHFVHRSADGALAVVGVLLVEGEADNPNFAPVFDNLPTEKVDVTTLAATVSAAAMLPDAKTYYTYSGSLTTPPCSEGVRWLLMTTPVELSAAQIEAFSAIFEDDARPVQPQNARDVIQDSGSDS